MSAKLENPSGDSAYESESHVPHGDEASWAWKFGTWLVSAPGLVTAAIVIASTAVYISVLPGPELSSTRAATAETFDFLNDTSSQARTAQSAELSRNAIPSADAPASESQQGSGRPQSGRRTPTPPPPTKGRGPAYPVITPNTPVQNLSAASDPVTDATLRGGTTGVSSTWINQMSGKTGIPPRALLGYATADLKSVQKNPSCKVTWTTLAAIGYLESWHGSYGGNRLLDNGNTKTPLFGPVYNGKDVALIKDTDRGALDGDAQFDRPVGPMKILPSVWREFATDAHGDASPDIHNIDDAALTVARALCANGADLQSGQGWIAAVGTFNNSENFARSAHAVASAYSRRSLE